MIDNLYCLSILYFGTGKKDWILNYMNTYIIFKILKYIIKIK